MSRMILEASGPARFALAVAVARGYDAEEALAVTLDGGPLRVEELEDDHGGRVHVFDAGPGIVEVRYDAVVMGEAAPPPVEPIDELRYLRPSRYCESDHLSAVARSEFQGLSGQDLLRGVSSWVGVHLAYEAGSSLPTDGATNTLLARRGVCRDFAHLVVAFLRALDVPARVVSVYAPGLEPMDFHAVAEALVDGAWHVVDATALAPRGSLVRIATGRDAADTAFLSNHGSDVQLLELEVGAIVDTLPRDDIGIPAILR